MAVLEKKPTFLSHLLKVVTLGFSFFTIAYTFGVLFQLIYVSSININLPIILSNLNAAINTTKPTKIFCLILTTKTNLDNKAKVVNQTWANKCDKYFFIAKVTNASDTSQEFSDPLPVLQPSNFVEDQYRLLTEKVYRSFVDVYAKYADYDWYLKADDDTYVFMDNLREFLKNKDKHKPVTYGHDFKVIVNNGYHSGGAGYVLSNEAFNRIGSTLTTNYTFCTNTGTEDVDVATCLRRLDVNPERSIDETGKQRFLPVNIRSYFNEIPSWLYDYSADPPRKGMNCCSENLISIHYMSPNDMNKMHILYENFKNSTFNIKNNSTNSTLLPFMSLLYQFVF